MAKIKIAINGFGRIGRLLFRSLIDDDFCEIVAINSLANTQTQAHLLKYDSSQGRFRADVSAGESALYVNGKTVQALQQADPAALPWKQLGVQIVLECSGRFTSFDGAHKHIDAGALKTIISAPAKQEDTKTIVYNVNHRILDGTEKVLSAASCTTNCLAFMAQVLEQSFGIECGFMTTVHAYTNDQNTLDAPHPKADLRRARAAASSIVPSSTGAAKAIGLVLPSLKGKLDGVSQRVPVLTGSLTELLSVLRTKVTVEQINAAMKTAANESFAYNEDEIVSADVIGSHFGSIFDATQTKIVEVGEKQLVKTSAWYDNEMSYTAQMVRLTKYIASTL